MATAVWRLPVKKSINKMFSYFLEKYGDQKSFLQLERMPVVIFYQVGVYSPKQWEEIRLNLRREGLNGVFLGVNALKTIIRPYLRVLNTIVPYQLARSLKVIFVENAPDQLPFAGI